MPSFENIDYTVTGGRAEVVLDRPEVMNAYDGATLEALVRALEAAAADDDVYAVVLSGRGRGFCAGVDLNETESHGETRTAHRRHREDVDAVYRLLYRGPKPTVAAVNGPAVGAGFGFAVSCDLRVMAESAVMRDGHLAVGQFPSAPAGWILPKLVGEAPAREVVLAGRDVGPERALELGLVSEVVPDGETMDAARGLADDLRDVPALAMRRAKRAINAPNSFEAYVRETVDVQWECRQDAERVEAVAAAREGRDPEYDR